MCVCVCVCVYIYKILNVRSLKGKGKKERGKGSLTTEMFVKFILFLLICQILNESQLSNVLSNLLPN